MKFPPYPEYKPSGVEWLGDVPAHWRLQRLKYVASINDEALPETTSPDYEFAYVDIGGVDPIAGIIKSDEVIFENAASRARRLVRDGDTIVSTVRTYLRAIAPIRTAQDNLIVSTGFAVVRPRRIDPGFLSYAVREPGFVDTIVARSVGVSYPAVNASEIGDIPLLIPPEAEQHSIAEYLDLMMKKIEKLVTRKLELIKRLTEKRSALIARTVTHGLPRDAVRAVAIDTQSRVRAPGTDWIGDIPTHWKIVPLRYQFQNLDNLREPVSGEDRANLEKIYPYYGASGVIDYVEEYLFNEILILVAEDGANLLSRSSPLAFLASGKYWVNNHAHILRPQSGDIRYWSYVLEMYDYTPLVTGAAQPKLTSERLGSIRLPKPPASEQTVIANFLDTETGKLDRMIARVREATERLLEYRIALITAAVTGKIDIRGASA
jgi:type I restriction enzyme S subunit